jgi:CRP-like cAMP-binding protein
MPLRELEYLFSESVLRKHTKGQIILYPGDSLTQVYYVRQGYVKMYSINDQGEERILMIFQPHSAFPIISHMPSSQPYELTYYYQAMTNTELHEMSREEFGKLLKTHDKVAPVVLEYVTTLAGELVRRLGIIENKDARNKVMSVLEYLIKTCCKQIGQDTYKVAFRVTHQDIASLAGLARETASAQLKQLEKDGIINQKKDGRLVIHEPPLSK